MNLIILTPVMPVLFQFLAWTISLAWAWASAFSTENLTAARNAASTADTAKETEITSTAVSDTAGDANTEKETGNTITAASDNTSDAKTEKKPGIPKGQDR